MDIEENIKILEEGIKELETSYELHHCVWAETIFEKMSNATKNILSEREQNKKRIDELKEYIPKQKVKEILDKAEVMDYYTLPDVIRDLEKLLNVEDK